MKKIAIVADDVAMPGEKGLSRLHYLAEFMTSKGLDVEIVTADFQHWEKRYRTEEDQKKIRELSKCKVTFLHEGAYKKNIDPKRMLSYRTLARNIKKHLEKNEYDLVYALIPDNHLCAVAGKYAKKRGIPFIVDVEDLWPEAMRMVLDVPVVSDVLFSYFTVNARKAYRLADGIVGSSDEYRDEPKKYGVNCENSVTVYVGNDVAGFDEGARRRADEVVKPENEFWVTYAGTLGTSYDIHTLIRAGKALRDRGHDNVRIVLLGDGPLRADFEKTAEETGAPVLFAGYLPHDLMAAYLVKSDVTVNSLVSKASQSIVSKIGDYLASEKPMINTGLNREFREKVEADGFGVNVEPENVQALADAIEGLLTDPEACEKMGRTARRIAVEQFDRPISYQHIVDLALKLMGEEK